MFFLGIGLILLALKYFGVAPVATLSWWWVALPFVLAALWWAWADWSGYTKSRAVARQEQRKQKRLERQRAELGLDPRRRR